MEQHLDRTPGLAKASPQDGPHSDLIASSSSSHDVVRRFAADLDAQWSAGTFGAIAEFSRDPDEPATLRLDGPVLSVATGRGAIALGNHAGVRVFAYETLSRDRTSWRHAVAFCLPVAEAAMGARAVVTELGEDTSAVRPQDRGAILFDLGLSLSQTDAAIRTSDPALIAALRQSEGKPLFASDNHVLMDILHANPHRVFLTRLGRVEVFQPIPPPAGKSPPGPHTHILPKLLRANRTHAATVPIPSGLVPCAMLYPAHPLLDGEGERIDFRRDRFEAFNDLLRRYGDPAMLAVGEEVAAAVRSGATPQSMRMAGSKFARATVRITLRKLKASGDRSPALEAWLAHFDLPADEDGAEEDQHAC